MGGHGGVKHFPCLFLLELFIFHRLYDKIDGSFRRRMADMKIETIGPILIKMKSQAIIESLRSGVVYMNELGYFRREEEREDNDEVLDRRENEIYSTAYELPGGIPCNYIMKQENSSNFAFCMFYIPHEQGRFHFSDKQKEKLARFGDTALIIKDFGEFICRTVKSAANEGFELHHREVFYYDEKQEVTMGMMDLLTKGMYNVSFFKRKQFRHQQEYRLVVNMEKTKRDHIKLQIGDISDISVQVSTKQMLEEGIDIQN